MRRYCNYCSCKQDYREVSGNEYVEAWGSSHVVAWESSHVEARGNSHVECKSPYAFAILKEATVKGIGNVIGNKPLTPKEYLALCDIKVRKGEAILYKSVNKDLTNGKDSSFQYEIGKEAIAPDWNPKFTEECGCGLHLSPTVGQAKSFHDSRTYLACSVQVKDIASLPAFAAYPDKIRVRACVPLYFVDESGGKVKSESERMS